MSNTVRVTIEWPDGQHQEMLSRKVLVLCKQGAGYQFDTSINPLEMADALSHLFTMIGESAIRDGVPAADAVDLVLELARMAAVHGATQIGQTHELRFGAEVVRRDGAPVQ